MKKNKVTYLHQSIYCMALLFVLLILCCTIFTAFLYKYRIVTFKVFVVILLLLILLSAITIVVFNRFVWMPTKKSREKFKRFGESLIYEELFEENYFIFPELQPVLIRFHDMMDKQSAIKISTKQAEYLALQNQINPHFLYNTLEAIRGDALSEGKEDIANITQALSKFFRYTITETDNLVTLEDELANAKNYFIIQEYRFGEKLKMVIELPSEEDDILLLQVPKLTLQPIIENSIFHGLEKKSLGGTVTIRVTMTETKVYISIHDDGVGIKERKLEEINARLERVSISYVNERRTRGSGIALKNVCRRIKLLFGEEYGIHIYSIPGFGTDVRIAIPIIWGKDMDL